MSVFGGADDEVLSNFDYEEDVQVEDESVVDGDLEEETISAQRLVVSRMCGYFTHGRAHVSHVDPSRKVTNEKMFNIPTLFDWDGKEPTELIEALSSGRVRARVNAAMGAGKTTRLGPLLARALDFRVLIVTLDARVLQQVGVYIASQGAGRFRRNYPSRPGEALCCMTYGDFNGAMVGGERARTFSSFDLIIFDEAFVASADVYVAKRAFSAFANSTVNLLLASATISADAGDGAGSASLGTFQHISNRVSVDAAIASGKLASDYLVDRTMVVVPVEMDIDKLVDHYELNGVDAKGLYSFSTYDDVEEVNSWLRTDSSTPRVVVCSSGYGIAFNLSVSYSIIWAERCYPCVEGDSFTEKVEPLCPPMVKQFMSRTGRGMVPGSGGLVMTPDRAPAVELYDSDRHTAFVKLCAMSIRPLQNGFWETSYALFGGVMPPPSLASKILKVGLPVEVSIRYFCKDGLVASKFANALNVFAQPDHFLMPSSEEYPTGYDKWVVEGYNGGGEVSGVRKVPLRASGEMHVILHGISAMAAGDFIVRRWRSRAVMAFDDGHDSDEDLRVSRFAGVPRLRRVVEPTRSVAYEEPVERPSAWFYRPEMQALEPPVEERRAGKFIHSERFQEALARMKRTMESEFVTESLAAMAPSPVHEGYSEVEVPTFGQVESPGGSVVCNIPTTTCEDMNVGKVLEPHQVMEVIIAAKPVVNGFVASRMFDGFSGPWESFLRSMDNERVVGEVVRKGESTVAYAIVDKLRSRLNQELTVALKTSHMTRSRFKKIFAKPPSSKSVMDAIRKGRFNNIAQTEAFFNRVKLLKCLLDAALLAGEHFGVYLPNHITSAQRDVYLGPTAVGSVGHGLYGPPVRLALPESVERNLQDNRLIRRMGGLGL